MAKKKGAVLLMAALVMMLMIDDSGNRAKWTNTFLSFCNVKADGICNCHCA